jgi:hypothetical protein
MTVSTRYVPTCRPPPVEPGYAVSRRVAGVAGSTRLARCGGCGAGLSGGVGGVAVGAHLTMGNQWEYGRELDPVWAWRLFPPVWVLPGGGQ